MSDEYRALIEQARAECHQWQNILMAHDGQFIAMSPIELGLLLIAYVRLADALEQEREQNKSEVSQLAADLSAANARAERLAMPAVLLAGHFISKTTNLVMMRCTYCLSEWVRDCPQEHDGDCPVGLVSAALGLAAERGDDRG